MNTSLKLFTAVLLLTVAGHALAGVRYVNVNNSNATPPFTSWTTAATNIQDAVDAAVAGDEVVVTNGIYAAGQRDGNRVVVDKPLSLRSINGPQFTTIDGGRSNRCVYLTNNATLSGFTLTNGVGQFGHASSWGPGPLIGGGLWCESPGAVASNCVISGNSTHAYFSLSGSDSGIGGGVYGGTLNNCTLSGNQALGFHLNGDYPGYGGGAAAATLNNCTVTGNLALYGAIFDAGGGVYFCTLNNCTLCDNSAGHSGGGAYNSTLNNCTLVGNSAAEYGGGASACMVNNCILHFNTAPEAANYDSDSSLNFSCTTPPPTNGIGNFTSDPLFVDTNGWANLRLQSISPCINAGNNAYVTNATDLAGNPRIAGGTVDMGAYEFQSLPPQLAILRSGENVVLAWPTNVAGFDYTGYTLLSTTNLGSPAVWITVSPEPVLIGGQNVVINPISGAQQFYRLSQRPWWLCSDSQCPCGWVCVSGVCHFDMPRGGCREGELP